MQRHLTRTAIYLAAALAAGALWLYTHSATAQIRRTFREIERLMAREQTESVMENTVKSRALAGYVAEGCVFTLKEFDFSGKVSREGFSGGVLAFRNDVKCIHLRFVNLEIQAADGMSHVTGKADFTGTDTNGRIVAPLVRDFSADLSKCPDGRWRFTGVAMD